MPNAAQWSKRVAAWKASGQTAKAYAAGRGWKATTLAWWGSNLARKAKAAEQVRLVPLLTSDAESRAQCWDVVGGLSAQPPSTILIEAPRGCVIRVQRDFDAELLGRVVCALEVR
jgi:hypothetical protein